MDLWGDDSYLEVYNDARAPQCKLHRESYRSRSHSFFICFWKMLPHALLLALATGAVAYKNAFMIEESANSAPLEKSVLETTLGCKVAPRKTFNAPVMTGQSFDVDCGDKYPGEASHVTKKLLNLLNGIESVTKAWEVKYSKPPRKLDNNHPPPTADSNKKRSVGKRQEPGPAVPISTPPPFAPHVSTGVDKVHAAGFTGKGRKIAIIDGGFNVEGVPGLEKTSIVHVENFVDRSSSTVSDNCSWHGTHILGILGANSAEKKFGVVGVAPDADYELYDVQACGEGAPSDRQIEAMLFAVERKVDVISMSIGGALAYPDDPASVVASRIHKNGTFVAFCNGNGGPGVFSAVSPAGGEFLTSVGSTDAASTPYNTWRGTVSDGTDFRYVPGQPQNLPFGGKPLTLWFPADAEKLDLPRNTCVPLPEGSQLPKDPANTILMIDFLHCWSSTSNGTTTPITADLGIKHVLYYQPEEFSGDEYGLQFWEAYSSDALDGVALVSHAKALELAEKLAKDPALSISFPKELDHRVDFSENLWTGDSMSQFSSWGPTLDGRMSPTISAPGGNILSVFPHFLGDWAVLSGTSQSTPFLAGVAALLQQKFEDVKPSPAEIQDIMTLSAKTLNFNDGKTKSDFLAPVLQQGAGLVNALIATQMQTRVSVSQLNFNDTDHRPLSLKFRLRNVGVNTTDYSISHLAAASGYILEPFGQKKDYQLTANEAREAPALLNITPDKVTLGPQSESDITISIASNPDLPDAEARGAFFGGYIAIRDGASLFTLPYSGFGSSLKSLPMIDQNATRMVQANESASVPYPPGEETKEPLFDCFYNTTAAVPLTCPDNNGLYPGVKLTFVIPSRQFQIDMMNVDGTVAIPQIDMMNVDGTVAIPQVYNGTAEEVWDAGRYWYWDGTDRDKAFLKGGSYRWRVTALRWSGDAGVGADWDSWNSEIWRVSYKKGSLFLAENE
ncbi:hypothetical protein HYALB_00010660 [Hymenoscyphus albidus]|uniref:Subtilisin-like protein n=1 Tax=Hymenoscyphus albidus TaxID=595503 RepID=A0A9N9LTU6_9HELO|nr:hypothetical protein HYALB_00010660 [Hymenoscyphus albidus]